MDIVGVGATSFQNYANGKPTPDVGKISGTPLSRFFQRYLLQRAMSVFKWTMPDTWAKEYVLYWLYCHGFVAVVRTDKFGVIPQACGLQGFNVMYRPTHAVISNPLLRGILTPEISTQCEILRLAPDFGGIADLVSFYGDMMALCARTAQSNLTNSQLSYLFTARNKAAAESFKEVYAKIERGEPMAIMDKALLLEDGSPAWQAFEQNVGQNYIAGQIIDDLRKWEQRFFTAIGIPNGNTEKKERLVVDEINANNVETTSLCELWLEELQGCCKRINKMFPGVELSVDWRNPPVKEVKNDGFKTVGTESR